MRDSKSPEINEMPHSLTNEMSVSFCSQTTSVQCLIESQNSFTEEEYSFMNQKIKCSFMLSLPTKAVVRDVGE